MLMFCNEILQHFQYSIDSKDWLLVEETSTWQCHNNYVDLVLKTGQRFYPWIFNKWKSSFRKNNFWFCIQRYLFLFLPVDVLKRLLKIKQIIKNTNIPTFKYAMTHWQSSILWMVYEFNRLSEELFLMYTFV